MTKIIPLTDSQKLQIIELRFNQTYKIGQIAIEMNLTKGRVEKVLQDFLIYLKNLVRNESEEIAINYYHLNDNAIKFIDYRYHIFPNTTEAIKLSLTRKVVGGKL